MGYLLPFSTARLEASFQSVTGSLLARQQCETRPGKLKSEAGMSASGDGYGSWGGAARLEQAPLPPAKVAGACCEFAQWGPGRS